MSSILNTVSYYSPAKLNLMLRILDQRQDGYHNLQTVFQFINLEDILQLTPSVSTSTGSVSLSLENTDLSLTDNLILKAADALKASLEYQTKYPHHQAKDIHIKLIKNIPIGGGLGGGSSNCATTLVALNTLWDLNLSQDRLQTIGRSLGADVPIFIYGQSAWAEGIGEKFQSIDLPEVCLGLICPNVHISTPLIFRSPFLTRNHPVLSISDYLNGICPNDCSATIFHHFPVMRQLMEILDVYQPQITGTGACIFLKRPPSIVNEIPLLLKKHHLDDCHYQIVETRNKSSLLIGKQSLF